MKNPVLTIVMFDLARKNGHADGLKRRDAVAEKMSSVQIREASNLVDAWKKGRPLPARSKTGAKRSS